MIRLNIHEAKTHLSRFLALLKPGEKILLCNRNIPVAEVTALVSAPSKIRVFDSAKGRVKISKDFLKPLPKNMEDLFYKG